MCEKYEVVEYGMSQHLEMVTVARKWLMEQLARFGGSSKLILDGMKV